VGKAIHCEWVADAKGSGDVALVASVMLGGRADVPTIMGRHVLSLVGRDMDNNASAWRGKRAVVELERAVKACMGG
jgi:hypothetical protein